MVSDDGHRAISTAGYECFPKSVLISFPLSGWGLICGCGSVSLESSPPRPIGVGEVEAVIEFFGRVVEGGLILGE